MALVRYLPGTGHVTGGRIRFDGHDLLDLDDAALRAFRGRRAAVVYQNPASALDPSMRVGDQVAEAHTSSGNARERVLELFQRVQPADPHSVYQRYAHQLSGGMEQRVVIAMALARQPDLLIFDEPTTGLDATVEAAILQLIANLRRELGVSVVMISHNLKVVSTVCDRVGVLYAGRLVEAGPVNQVFDAPAHPYTRGLIASLPGEQSRKSVRPLHAIAGTPLLGAPHTVGCVFAPRCEFARPACTVAEPPLFALDEARSSRCYFSEEVVATPARPTADRSIGYVAMDRNQSLLDVTDARKTFRVTGGKVLAVDGVSLEIRPGMTVGLVGESGSGKSTLARVIAGLEPLDSGALHWRGRVLPRSVQRRSRSVLRELQMVFQDPDSTLNPRHSIGALLERSIRRLTNLSGAARRARSPAHPRSCCATSQPPRSTHRSRQPSSIFSHASNPSRVARICSFPTTSVWSAIWPTSSGFCTLGA